MIKAAMLPFLIAATAALLSGQPISSPPSLCGGMKISGDGVDLSSDIPPQRRFAPPSSGDRLCSQYTYGGWQDTLQLYLGEGAEEYLLDVQYAVYLWNEAVMGFNQTPLIEIIEHSQPKTFTLGEDFWENSEAEMETHIQDRQSVIYFKPASTDSSTRGIAYLWTQGGRMVQSDIYLNTRPEMLHGRVSAYTTWLKPTEWGFIHAFVDPLFLAILHEIGHAVGLKHVPISGNIMSYNYMPALRAKWMPALESLEYSLSVMDKADELQSLAQSQFQPSSMLLTTEWELYLRDVYTTSVELGQQDRMALMCIYDFEDWNH